MNNRIFQDYIQRLQDLQDGKQAPHKPFFLLIIIEMLESGELSENRISFGEIEKNKSFFAELMRFSIAGTHLNGDRVSIIHFSI